MIMIIKNLIITVIFSINLFALNQVDYIDNDNLSNNRVAATKKEKEIRDLNSIQKVFFNEKKIKALKKHHTIQNIRYIKNKTIYIRTRVSMNSFIIFPKDEEIIGYDIGDSNFDIEVINSTHKNNVIKIKPIKYVQIDSDLIVFGKTGNVYTFYIWSTDYQHKYAPHLTTYIHFSKSMKRALKRKKKKMELKAKRLKEKIAKKIKDINLTHKKKKNIFLSDINELDFKYHIFNDDNKIIKVVFRNKDKTFVKLRTNYIPQFFNELNEEIPFSKKGRLIALDFTGGIFFIKDEDDTIKIQKIKRYKIEKIRNKNLVHLDELEFNYYMKVKFDGWWDNLFKDFDKDDDDVKKFTPEIVFNDKRFTYFKFNMDRSDKTFPQIYKVTDEKDTLINHTIAKDYERIDILNNKFTLRVGKKHLCIGKRK